MIILLGSARFEPGEAERLRPAMIRWAETVRSRDGCLEYQMNQDVEDPDLLHVAERWRDQAAVDAHIADLGVLMEGLEGARMEWLDLRAYTTTGSRLLLEQVPAGMRVTGTD
jgi:quinol monooxygenase YgiN